ncbi:unnamed protein product [Angiostrongylus costaricensis]|uniref:Aa_trans domain-containing protein n=1 Tax=Angiostrongylus costaricensis TaxID=334426 RepID=A0A158PCY7_ANGCS|nr:unnamed protein product [Angiostrongylus costaricensis]
MFCVGFPMTYLELALGQYTHATVLAVFDRIAPIAVGTAAISVKFFDKQLLVFGRVFVYLLVTSGEDFIENILVIHDLFRVGVSAVLLLAVSLLLGNDLIVIMVDTFFKSANAFTNQLPWDNCIGMNSRAHCQSVDRDCQNVKPFGILPGRLQQRFYNLARYSDFYTLTVAKWPSSVFMAWIVIIFLGIAHLLATNRQAIIKSISYICMSIIFLLTFMIVLVFVHLNPPKYPALAFLDAVNFKQERGLAMWVDAVVMACTILQLGYGGVIFLGMQNPFFNDLVT